MSDSLEDRLRAFDLLELSGQPQGMHMGTSYLMHDLWNEIQRLEAENARLRTELAAKRERCAQIADKYICAGCNRDVGAPIAAAIRKDE